MKGLVQVPWKTWQERSIMTTSGLFVANLVSFLGNEEKESAFSADMIKLLPGSSGQCVFDARLGLVALLCEHNAAVLAAVDAAATSPVVWDYRLGAEYVPRNRRLAEQVLSELAYRTRVPSRNSSPFVVATRKKWAFLLDAV